MAGYTRNDTSNNIADGNVVNASDLDGEFDAIVSAFNSSTGHTHDGTSAEGAPIEKVGPVQDLVITATEVKPKTSDTLDLGTNLLLFKDLFIDGTATLGDVVIDNDGTIGSVSDADAIAISDGGVVTFSQAPVINVENATTNAVTDVLTLRTQSTGTPAVGIGAGMLFSTETAAGTLETGGAIRIVTTGLTPTAEEIDLVFYSMRNGSLTEAFRYDSDGDTFDVTGSINADGLVVDTDTLYVDATNNRVGIGTNSPSALFEIADASPQIQFTDTVNASAYSRILATDSGTLILDADKSVSASNSNILLRVDDADRVKVESTGDISFYEDTGTTAKFFWDASAESLGINTTSPNVGNASVGHGVITLAGTASSQSGIIELTAPNQTLDARALGLIRFYNGTNENARIESRSEGAVNDAGNLQFETSSTGGSLTERMRISSSGNISFYEDTGATARFVWDASAEDLTITSGVAGGTFTDAESVRGSTNGLNTQLQIYQAGGSDGGISIAAGSSGSAAVGLYANKSGTNQADFIIRQDDGTGTSKETFRITDSGNVGIGTDSPSTNLEVSSASTNTSVSITNTSSYLNLQSNSDDGYINLAGSGDIIFRNGSPSVSESIRIDSSKNIDMTNGGGNIIMANGAGIDFSASEGAGATTSVLDDYERGTWTPSYGGTTTNPAFTYNERVGYYVKVGKIVHAYFHLRCGPSGTAGTGDMVVTGLPFAAQGTPSGNAGRQAGTVSDTTNWAANNYPNAIESVEEAAYLSLRKIFTDQNTVSVSAASVNTGNQSQSMFAQITYLVD